MKSGLFKISRGVYDLHALRPTHTKGSLILELLFESEDVVDVKAALFEEARKYERTIDINPKELCLGKWNFFEVNHYISTQPYVNLCIYPMDSVQEFTLTPQKVIRNIEDNGFCINGIAKLKRTCQSANLSLFIHHEKGVTDVFNGKEYLSPEYTADAKSIVIDGKVVVCDSADIKEKHPFFVELEALIKKHNFDYYSHINKKNNENNHRKIKRKLKRKRVGSYYRS